MEHGAGRLGSALNSSHHAVILHKPLLCLHMHKNIVLSLHNYLKTKFNINGVEITMSMTTAICEQRY